MKILLSLGLIPFVCSAAIYDKNSEIPVIGALESESESFMKIHNVAQYGLADWSKAVGIARGITRNQALQIAESDPEITYFFYTKGGQMVLGNEEVGYRIFHHGDTVFFTGQPWWGSADDLADGYIRR